MAGTAVVYCNCSRRSMKSWRSSSCVLRVVVASVAAVVVAVVVVLFKKIMNIHGHVYKEIQMNFTVG